MKLKILFLEIFYYFYVIYDTGQNLASIILDILKIIGINSNYLLGQVLTTVWTTHCCQDSSRTCTRVSVSINIYIRIYIEIRYLLRPYVLQHLIVDTHIH